MMTELLRGGKVAFFHSDPAGAKVCLSLAYLLRHADPQAQVKLLSNRRYDFEQEWEVPVQHVAGPLDEACLDDVATVFTGTSHPASSDGFELRALALAKRLERPTFSFIDHWVNFRLRFQQGAELVLPDHIVVPDDHAVELAASEGLPRERLMVHANPYLTYLAQLWRPRRSRATVRTALGLPSLEAPLLLYAPDPISLRPPVLERGFTEVSATRDLLASLAALPPEVRVVAQLHPLQPGDTLAPMLAAAPRVLPLSTRGITVPELIHASDLVVGFYSNLLLEAYALGCPVVRYYPSPNPSTDPLGHLAFGTKVTTVAGLAPALADALAEGRQRSIPS